MKSMINIGNEKEVVMEAGKVILDILNSGQEQETIKKALDILPKIFTIQNITISGCSIINKKDSSEDPKIGIELGIELN